MTISYVLTSRTIIIISKSGIYKDYNIIKVRILKIPKKEAPLPQSLFVDIVQWRGCMHIKQATQCNLQNMHGLDLNKSYLKHYKHCVLYPPIATECPFTLGLINSRTFVCSDLMVFFIIDKTAINTLQEIIKSTNITNRKTNCKPKTSNNAIIHIPDSGALFLV